MHPRQFGLTTRDIAAVQVGSSAESAALMREVLAGATGAARDIVALNAGAAIYVSGMAESLEAGVSKAIAVIDDGRAQRKLDDLAAFTAAMRG